MPSQLRWGILGASNFAIKKAVPGLLQSTRCQAVGFASRDLSKAVAAGHQFGLSRAWGSYEDLLTATDIDAVYIPLPNHLHVPWAIRAAASGKHVLCEKPIALNTAELRQLIAARDKSGVKIGEAFMVRTHPQWLRAKEIADSGRLGELRAIAGFFSYFNANPDNIRNKPDLGGGGLMDIGCYPIFTSRFIFGAEPIRVQGALERDPALGTDRLTSALLEFPGGRHAIFTCSTQLVPYQRMQIYGTKGRLEIEIPFNAPPDRPTRIFIDDGGELFGSQISTETFPVCDQYTIQFDEFARAVAGERDVPVPLEDSLGNMAVIDALAVL